MHPSDPVLVRLKYDIIVALANDDFSNLFEFERCLSAFTCAEAKILWIRMWDTMVAITEEIRHQREAMLKDDTLIRGSLLSARTMPYDLVAGYRVSDSSFAAKVLGMTFDDSEFVFEWSKLAGGTSIDTTRTFPRVVIDIQDKKVDVISNTPVEYFVRSRLKAK